MKNILISYHILHNIGV